MMSYHHYLIILCLVFYVRLEAQAPMQKPNIILIMADDLGYADVGCYGQSVIQTPHIDRLGTEGLRFTQCYSGSPVCAPARSVLMTGKHTGHTTVRGNNGLGGVVGLEGLPGRIPLLETDTTLAEVLHDAGYTTGIIGKWGLGEPNTSGHPNLQGFDEFVGFLNQRRAHSYYPDYIWRNTEKWMLPSHTDGSTPYVHDIFTEEALSFIHRYQERPFFLYLPYTTPHEHLEIPSTGQYADSLHWTEDERIYAAMVSRLDRDIGRILDTLNQLGLEQHTLIIFCSDNGPAFAWENRFQSAGTLRGIKRDLYEGGIRIPMILRYPGVIPAGTRSTLPWYFADMLPTLAALSNSRPPAQIDGVNLWPTILGKPIPQTLKQRPLYWEFHERGFQQAVRWKDWKAVRLSTSVPWELYHLGKDSTEQQNIAQKKPHILQRITRFASQAHQPSPFFPVAGEAFQ